MADRPWPVLLCLPLLLAAGDAYEEHLNKFNDLFGKSQFQAALGELESLRKLKKEPDPVLLLDFGVVHLRLGHADEALRFCGNALDLAPRDAEERGAQDKARRCKEKALKLLKGSVPPPDPVPTPAPVKKPDRPVRHPRKDPPADRAPQQPAAVDPERSMGDPRPFMVHVDKGEFLMGSPETEKDRSVDERQHRVVISRDFEIAETEVTQGQYQRVTGKTPSAFKGNKELPVENVSWLDAVAYCNRLSEKERKPSCYRIDGDKVTWQAGLSCGGYRLPTGAEWEYAARGGGKTDFVYAGSNDPAKVAWFDEGSSGKTHPVKGKEKNQLGLYDMSGNVWEWVWDWYDQKYPSHSVTDPIGPSIFLGLARAAAVNLPYYDPIGPSSGSGRVFRGGSFVSPPQNLRVAFRSGDSPDFRVRSLGFRVARSLP